MVYATRNRECKVIMQKEKEKENKGCQMTKL